METAAAMAIRQNTQQNYALFLQAVEKFAQNNGLPMQTEEGTDALLTTYVTHLFYLGYGILCAEAVLPSSAACHPHWKRHGNVKKSSSASCARRVWKTRASLVASEGDLACDSRDCSSADS